MRYQRDKDYCTVITIDALRTLGPEFDFALPSAIDGKAPTYGDRVNPAAAKRQADRKEAEAFAS